MIPCIGGGGGVGKAVPWGRAQLGATACSDGGAVCARCPPSRHWGPLELPQPNPAPSSHPPPSVYPSVLLRPLSAISPPGFSACPHQEGLQTPTISMPSTGLSQQFPVCPELGAQHWAQCSSSAPPGQSRGEQHSLPCWLHSGQCTPGSCWPSWPPGLTAGSIGQLLANH